MDPRPAPALSGTLDIHHRFIRVHDSGDGVGIFPVIVCWECFLVFFKPAEVTWVNPIGFTSRFTTSMVRHVLQLLQKVMRLKFSACFVFQVIPPNSVALRYGDLGTVLAVYGTALYGTEASVDYGTPTLGTVVHGTVLLEKRWAVLDDTG